MPSRTTSVSSFLLEMMTSYSSELERTSQFLQDHSVTGYSGGTMREHSDTPHQDPPTQLFDITPTITTPVTLSSPAAPATLSSPDSGNNKTTSNVPVSTFKPTVSVQGGAF